MERKHSNGSQSYSALQQLPDNGIFFQRWDQGVLIMVFDNNDPGSW